MPLDESTGGGDRDLQQRQAHKPNVLIGFLFEKDEQQSHNMTRVWCYAEHSSSDKQPRPKLKWLQQLTVDRLAKKTRLMRVAEWADRLPT